MKKNKVTGVLDRKKDSELKQYFQPDFLEALLGKKIISVAVKERDLFASGDSRLWHCRVVLEGGSEVELYGKYLRQESAKRQADLLIAFATSGLHCPVVIFTSPNDSFYIYKAVIGTPLLEKLEVLDADSVAENVFELATLIHKCQTANAYLRPIDTAIFRSELDKHIVVARQLIPRRQTELDQSYQAVQSSLDGLVGKTPIHGDLNPWNIIDQDGQMGIIDFREAGLARPELDFGILIGSLDLIIVTRPELRPTLVAFKKALINKLSQSGLKSSLLQAGYATAIFKHLWVIGSYGLEIEKGKPLAEDLFGEFNA